MSALTHAVASPSKAAMWLECANALSANEGQPEGDKKAADLGTDKHELLTLCLIFTMNARDYEGHVLGKGHVVNNELARDVQTVIDNVRECITYYERLGCTVTLELDTSVPIEHITGEKGATGTLDVALLAKWPDGLFTLIVIDAKFGYYEVSADNNPQLIMYGSGYLSTLDASKCTEVSLVIDQPAHGVNEWLTSSAKINNWVQDYARPRAEKALAIYNRGDGSALKLENFSVTEKGCKWCKAKATCPALQAQLEKDFETKSDSEDTPLEHLGELFPRLQLMEDWIKAVRGRVEHEMLAGKRIPGLKLVSGKRGNRAWANEEEAEALMKKFKMKQGQMYSFKLLGPKPILETLKDQPRRIKQIESLITQAEGKPSVVLESDKRPSLEIEPVENGFETLDDLC